MRTATAMVVEVIVGLFAKRVSVPAEKPPAPGMLLVFRVTEYGRPELWKKPPLVSSRP